MNRPYTAHSPYSLSPTERIPSHGDDDGGETVDLDRERYDEYQDVDEYDEYAGLRGLRRLSPIDRRWLWVGRRRRLDSARRGDRHGGDPQRRRQRHDVGDGRSADHLATGRDHIGAAGRDHAVGAPARSDAAAGDDHHRDADRNRPAQRRADRRGSRSRARARAAHGHLPGDRQPQLFDLVTVIYTDEQGALQTDVNVALPWTKTVVLDPGVTLNSVTATSVAGQLNCSITDASGTAIAAQTNNTMIANCTQVAQARPSSCMRVLCVRCSRSKNSVIWPRPSAPDTTRSTSSSWSASTYWAWVMASPSSRRDHSASR